MRKSLISLHIDKATVPLHQPRYRLSRVLTGVTVALFLAAAIYSILLY